MIVIRVVNERFCGISIGGPGELSPGKHGRDAACKIGMIVIGVEDERFYGINTLEVQVNHLLKSMDEMRPARAECL